MYPRLSAKQTNIKSVSSFNEQIFFWILAVIRKLLSQRPNSDNVNSRPKSGNIHTPDELFHCADELLSRDWSEKWYGVDRRTRGKLDPSYFECGRISFVFKFPGVFFFFTFVRFYPTLATRAKGGEISVLALIGKPSED